MEFRNKKTGDIKDWDFSNWYQTMLNPENKEKYECNLNDFIDRVAKFREEWEDVEDINVPNMPLIKDEKIRKVVRAWAEANNVLEVFAERVGDGTYMTLLELYDDDDERRRISVPSDFRPAGLKAGEAYTIAELCGEEEE